MASRIDDLRRENHDQAPIRIRHWGTNVRRPAAIQSGGALSNPLSSGLPGRRALIHEFGFARARSRSRSISMT